MPKYYFENGVMKLDPAFQAQQNFQQGPQQNLQQGNYAYNPQTIAIVSSTQDIQYATQAQQAAMGMPMQMENSTISTMEMMQGQYYLAQFKTSEILDGGDLLDGLSELFERYEVPIGLVNKLIPLTEYSLNFIIDDSGSMGTQSDLPIQSAHPMVRQLRDPDGRRARENRRLTRWEEAEDRIHIMLDMLAYLPIERIQFSFLNRQSDNMILSHVGRSPAQFAAECHQAIGQLFNCKPRGGTPLYKKLSEAFGQSTGNTMHYLFTDGEPSDASIAQVQDLVLNRPNPKMNPLTFISCTDSDKDAEWMKEIEGKAPYTAELDDYISEGNEVRAAQGPSFPFSRGFWLICQLVAAIHPHDLDALDESVPFTKKTMNELMGRNITIEEYRHYFQTNPNAVKNYSHLRQEFEREDILADQIIHPQYAYNQYYGNNNPNGFFSGNQQTYNSQTSQPYYSVSNTYR